MGALLLFNRGLYVLGAVALLPAVAATWLAGIWVVPRSVDAYQRRVSRALRDWGANTSHVWDRGAMQRTRIAVRFARVDVPPRFAGAHDQGVALLATADALRTDRSITFAERARRAAVARQELRALEEQVRDVASTADERAYAGAFAAALSKRDDVYRQMARAAEAATERALAKLGRMRVPVEWAGQHAELSRRLAAYRDASLEFHAVVDVVNRAEVEAAAGEFERAQSELSDYVRETSSEFARYWRGLGASPDRK